MLKLLGKCKIYYQRNYGTTFCYCRFKIEKLRRPNAVYEQVVKNAEDITTLKENQKIIGNVVNQIATIQQRQEDTINLLARRSLDQEGNIKRIK